MSLTESQQACLDLLNSPGVYPDGVDAIGEPSIDDNDNLVIPFQDGKKLLEMTVIGEPPESYSLKILNPDEID